MQSWILKLVIQWVISFLLTEIESVGAKLDWAKISADVDAKIRHFVPRFFAGAAVALANQVIGVAHRVLADEADLKKVMDLVAAEDFMGAAAALRDLILAALGLGKEIIPVIGGEDLRALLVEVV